jgi:hypothetical protein
MLHHAAWEFLFCKRIFVETPNGFIITNQFAYILVGTPKPLCITILLLVGPWRRVAPVNYT